MFYGDPAWEARMISACDPYYTVEVAREGGSPTAGPGRCTYSVVLTTLQAGNWTPTCADDKLTLPGRPPFHLLPAGSPAFKGVGDTTLVVTPLFILVPASGPFQSGEVTAHTFTCDDTNVACQ